VTFSPENPLLTTETYSDLTRKSKACNLLQCLPGFGEVSANQVVEYAGPTCLRAFHNDPIGVVKGVISRKKTMEAWSAFLLIRRHTEIVPRSLTIGEVERINLDSAKMYSTAARNNLPGRFDLSDAVISAIRTCRLALPAYEIKTGGRKKLAPKRGSMTFPYLPWTIVYRRPIDGIDRMDVRLSPWNQPGGLPNVGADIHAGPIRCDIPDQDGQAVVRLFDRCWADIMSSEHANTFYHYVQS